MLGGAGWLNPGENSDRDQRWPRRHGEIRINLPIVKCLIHAPCPSGNPNIFPTPDPNCTPRLRFRPLSRTSNQNNVKNPLAIPLPIATMPARAS